MTTFMFQIITSEPLKPKNNKNKRLAFFTKQNIQKPPHHQPQHTLPHFHHNSIK